MKAIILAGGIGSRLFPITIGVSKQLLSVYDKPMVYYPLSVLILAGISDILIICTREHINSYKRLLGDGGQWGIQLQYQIQEYPKGIADAFILGEKFVAQDPVCLILGDNIFYGLDFSDQLKEVVDRTRYESKATIFGYTVKDPQRYGVIEFDNNNNPISIEEKPENPKSKIAVVGLYFYPNSVIQIAKSIKPSKRGELEISDINRHFLKNNKLIVERFSRGFAWLDTGTPESLLKAGQFIETIEKRQGLKIGCIEEISFKKGFITKEQLIKQAKALEGTRYGDYLLNHYS